MSGQRDALDNARPSCWLKVGDCRGVRIQCRLIDNGDDYIYHVKWNRSNRPCKSFDDAMHMFLEAVQLRRDDNSAKQRGALQLQPPVHVQTDGGLLQMYMTSRHQKTQLPGRLTPASGYRQSAAENLDTQTAGLSDDGHLSARDAPLRAPAAAARILQDSRVVLATLLEQRLPVSDQLQAIEKLSLHVQQLSTSIGDGNTSTSNQSTPGCPEGAPVPQAPAVPQAPPVALAGVGAAEWSSAECSSLVSTVVQPPSSLPVASGTLQQGVDGAEATNQATVAVPAVLNFEGFIIQFNECTYKAVQHRNLPCTCKLVVGPCIGTGGFGTVHSLTVNQDDAAAAASLEVGKLPRLVGKFSIRDLVHQPDLEMQQREIYALDLLQGIDGAVRLFGVGSVHPAADGSCCSLTSSRVSRLQGTVMCVVLEQHSMTMEEWVDHYGPQSPPAVAWFLYEVLALMQLLHSGELGWILVHRDIKLENLLVPFGCAGGDSLAAGTLHPVLNDFGTVRYFPAGDKEMLMHTGIGTFSHMGIDIWAQLDSQKGYSKEIDLSSLAVATLHLVLGDRGAVEERFGWQPGQSYQQHTQQLCDNFHAVVVGRDIPGDEWDDLRPIIRDMVNMGPVEPKAADVWLQVAEWLRKLGKIRPRVA